MSSSERLHHGFARQARDHPDRVCLLDGERATTYGAVAGRAARLAVRLRNAGLRPGQRVAMLLPNSVRFVVAYWALLEADAIAVPLHPQSSAREARLILRHCDAGWLIVGPSWHRQTASWGVRRLCLGDGEAAILAEDGSRDPVRPDGRRCNAACEAPRSVDEPVLILYTSGSTGRPKGVTLSHRNLVANTRSILAYLDLQADDRALALLPFSYAYGLSVLNTHLWRGASLVVERRSAFPPVVFSTLAEQRVSGFPGVPSTFLLLLARGPERPEGPALRYLTCAGARLPPCAVDPLLRLFPTAELYLMYGATEASARLAYLAPERVRQKPDSIGRPVVGVRMEVRRDGRVADDGEVGEIWVSGANLSRGYWPLTDSDRLLVDGWYDTGDLGWRDVDGDFHLLGRADQLVKIAGHRVSLTEIEERLMALDEVIECAVVAREHAAAGTRTEAHVVPADGTVRVETLRRRLRAALPWFKRPGEIYLVDALPRGASGKILRHRLGERR